VRKLANRVRGEILVGVEVLSYRPIPVELAPASGGPAIQALYMPGIDPNAKAIRSWCVSGISAPTRPSA